MYCKEYITLILYCVRKSSSITSRLELVTCAFRSKLVLLVLNFQWSLWVESVRMCFSRANARLDAH